MAEPTEEKVEDTESETEEEKAEEIEEKAEDVVEEIPVRKPWNNRQERAEFFKKRQKEDEDEEGDEELTPAAQKAMQRELKKALDPLAEILSKSQADSEVNSYLSANPTLKKFEKSARQWMEKHPTLTAESAFTLASKGKVEIDPEAKAKAEEKAKRASLAGGGVRKDVSAVPQTEAEMKKVYEQVKRGKTIKIG